jgi:hypothetical protein
MMLSIQSYRTVLVLTWMSLYYFYSTESSSPSPYLIYSIFIETCYSYYLSLSDSNTSSFGIEIFDKLLLVFCMFDIIAGIYSLFSSIFISELAYIFYLLPNYTSSFLILFPLSRISYYFSSLLSLCYSASIGFLFSIILAISYIPSFSALASNSYFC